MESSVRRSLFNPSFNPSFNSFDSSFISSIFHSILSIQFFFQFFLTRSILSLDRAKDRKSREVVALKRMRMEKDDTGLPISSLREISILQGSLLLLFFFLSSSFFSSPFFSRIPLTFFFLSLLPLSSFVIPSINLLSAVEIRAELRHKNIVTLRSVVVGKEDLDRFLHSLRQLFLNLRPIP